MSINFEDYVNGDILRLDDIPALNLKDAMLFLETKPNIAQLIIQENRIGSEGAKVLAESKWLEQLTKIELYNTQIGDEGLKALANSRYLLNLTELSVKSNQISVVGVKALASSPSSLNLTELDLSFNQIGVEGANVISSSECFKNLSKLRLCSTWMYDAGVKALADSPYLGNLTELDLPENEIRTRGSEALAKSKYLTNLRKIELSENLIGDKGAEALANSTNFKSLTRLALAENKIGNKGSKALCKSENLKSLTHIKLNKNLIGKEGVEALADSPNFKNLTELGIGENKIGVEGIKALAKSKYVKNLTRLELYSNSIRNEGVEAIANSPNFKNLSELDISYNKIGAEGAQSLAKSNYLKNLTQLDVCGNYILMEGAEALGISSNLKNLTKLNISYNRIHITSLLEPVASKYSPNLKRLLLSENNVSSIGAEALARSPCLENLTELNLRECSIEDEGVIALANSQYLKHLVDLVLDSNEISKNGVKALAASPCLRNLTRLDLSNNEIQAMGAKVLADSEYLTNLKILLLRESQIGNKGVQYLANSLALKKLTSLWIDGNGISAQGANALANSTTFTNLTKLYINNNEIGWEGTKALANSPYLTNLTKINLSSNGIGIKGVEYLARSQYVNYASIILGYYENLAYDCLNAIWSSKRTDAPMVHIKTITKDILYLSRHANNEAVLKHILSSSYNYPFLINSKDSAGRGLYDYYSHSSKMLNFLFEHGLIPKVEVEKTLKNVVRDTQSTHNTEVNKKTKFYVKELVKSIKVDKMKLENAATSFLQSVSALSELYEKDSVRLRLLSLIDSEKASVMEIVLREGDPIPEDKDFVKSVFSKVQRTLSKRYLKKNGDGGYEEGFPTYELQYDYDNENAKITIPQAIGYIKLLIDHSQSTLQQQKELLVTAASQNPNLVSHNISTFRSVLNNPNISETQIGDRSEFHKLLESVDCESIKHLFRELCQLNIEEVSIEQKQLMLVSQIFIAATTYGESSSACSQGVITQIISTVDQVDPEWLEKFYAYLEEERVREMGMEVITPKNILAFVKLLADHLIKYVDGNTKLKKALCSFAIATADITQPESLNFDQQAILVQINKEFKSIRKTLPNYTRERPTGKEYKVIIEQLSTVKELQEFTMQYFSSNDDSSEE